MNHELRRGIIEARQEGRRLAALAGDLAEELEAREGMNLAGPAAPLYLRQMCDEVGGLRLAFSQATALLAEKAPRLSSPQSEALAFQPQPVPSRAELHHWLQRLSATALLVDRQVQSRELLVAEEAAQLASGLRRACASLAAWSRDLGLLAPDSSPLTLEPMGGPVGVPCVPPPSAGPQPAPASAPSPGATQLWAAEWHAPPDESL